MTTALEDARQQGRLTRVLPTYGYYRQANGWITVSVVTDLEELKYRREGWEPLHQYGRFDMTTEYAADHPLEQLFMFGGAKELIPEQIIQCGLHLNPPLVPTCRHRLDQDHKLHTAACFEGARPVEFPQIEGMDIEPRPCRFCENAPYPTDAARNQHEKVCHKEEKGDIRTGETLAAAMVKGLTPASPEANGLTDEQIAALQAAGLWDEPARPRRTRRSA